VDFVWIVLQSCADVVVIAVECPPFAKSAKDGTPLRRSSRAEIGFVWASSILKPRGRLSPGAREDEVAQRLSLAWGQFSFSQLVG
jgi:hypothetical protein